MKLNVKLLRKVQQHILEEPRRATIDRWVQHVGPLDVDAPPCGTAACIAGWCVLLSTPEDKWDEILELDDEDSPISKMAARKLRVPLSKVRRLFTFRESYALSRTQALAQEMAARIDRFIRRHA
jgi:hypothetical protein